MNFGKQKCEALKAIRKQIADLNNIQYVPCECTHTGECMGTCPTCERERQYIEEQLSIKKKKGNILKIAGVAAGLSAITAFQEAVAQEQTMNVDSTAAKFEWDFYPFTFGQIPRESWSQFDEMAEFVSKYPNDTFLVVGHTDSRGNDGYNLKLSESRANYTRTLLIERGVDPEKIIAIGCGETEPKIPNAETEPEHEQNRRVTLEFYSQQRVKEIEKKTKNSRQEFEKIKKKTKKK
ncbi:MAG: OmpA family protein [Paludibacteraceae bacterium]|nr:OmpA family protein [Paludibacteraceae bacterium]